MNLLGNTDVITDNVVLLTDAVTGVVERVPMYENKQTKIKILSFLLMLKNDMRFHTLTYGENPRLLWDKISEVNEVSDFVLDGTMVTLAKALRFNSTLKDLGQQIAHACHLLKASGSVISIDKRETISTEATSKQVFSENPWLLFVVGLYLSDSTDEIISTLKEEISGDQHQYSFRAR